MLKSIFLALLLSMNWMVFSQPSSLVLAQSTTRRHIESSSSSSSEEEQRDNRTRSNQKLNVHRNNSSNLSVYNTEQQQQLNDFSRKLNQFQSDDNRPTTSYAGSRLGNNKNTIIESYSSSLIVGKIEQETKSIVDISSRRNSKLNSVSFRDTHNQEQHLNQNTAFKENTLNNNLSPSPRTYHDGSAFTENTLENNRRPSNIQNFHDNSAITEYNHTPESKLWTFSSNGENANKIVQSPSSQHRGTNRKKSGNKRLQRVCEQKYAEYMSVIYPNDNEIAEDANDTEFDGRTLAEPGEYPHMAALGFKSQGSRFDYKCGGSLISENFVITAAHCTNLTGQEPKMVRIGDLNLLVDEHYLEPQLRSIKRIYNHPDYEPESYYHDIALLELSENIELTEFVHPIRLWVSLKIPFRSAYAMGYGATAFAKASTNRLTDFNLTIVPNDVCKMQLPEMPEVKFGILDSQICARDFKKNRDTCQGDSGGPLQLHLFGRLRRNIKHYHLIGITSFGLFCRSEYPSVYTRVSSYLDWIEDIVWKK